MGDDDLFNSFTASQLDNAGICDGVQLNAPQASPAFDFEKEIE